MQSASIIFASVVAAVLYGVVHDQFTARISIEYFTIGHPRLFPDDSPTIHAAAWGVLATWWVGLALGILLARSARGGALPKLSARRIFSIIAAVMLFAGVSALLAGLVAWFLATRDLIQLSPEWARLVSPDQHRGFLIDSWVHLASYAAGGFGGVAACLAARRLRIREAPSAVQHSAAADGRGLGRAAALAGRRRVRGGTAAVRSLLRWFARGRS